MESSENSHSSKLGEVVLRFQEHTGRIITPEQLELLKALYGFTQEGQA